MMMRARVVAAAFLLAAVVLLMVVWPRNGGIFEAQVQCSVDEASAREAELVRRVTELQTRIRALIEERQQAHVTIGADPDDDAPPMVELEPSAVVSTSSTPTSATPVLSDDHLPEVVRLWRQAKIDWHDLLVPPTSTGHAGYDLTRLIQAERQLTAFLTQTTGEWGKDHGPLASYHVRTDSARADRIPLLRCPADLSARR